MNPGIARAFRVAAGAVVVALGTWWLGWTAPVIWGALVGLAQPRRSPARVSAMSAALGWLLVLGFLVTQGDPVPLLAQRLAGAMGVPEWGLIAVTLLFPALLAACAATVAAAIRLEPKVEREIAPAR